MAINFVLSPLICGRAVIKPPNHRQLAGGRELEESIKYVTSRTCIWTGGINQICHYISLYVTVYSNGHMSFKVALYPLYIYQKVSFWFDFAAKYDASKKFQPKIFQAFQFLEKPLKDPREKSIILKCCLGDILGGSANLYRCFQTMTDILSAPFTCYRQFLATLATQILSAADRALTFFFSFSWLLYNC